MIPWICFEETFPRSLNIGSRTFSTNHTGAMVESGIMKLAWICTSLVEWRRWIDKVPREQVGTVAVLREILRSRFSTRPLTSMVSVVDKDRVAMMPWTERE